MFKGHSSHKLVFTSLKKPALQFPEEKETLEMIKFSNSDERDDYTIIGGMKGFTSSIQNVHLA